MTPRILLSSKEFSLIINRLCYQLIENHDDFSESVIIGIQPRGVHLSDRLVKRLNKIDPKLNITYGKLDPTFYRDDFRRKDKPIIPSTTDINFLIEDKKVILVDDVFYTGRTVRSALNALQDFGRSEKVELMVLIDRRYSRQLPIQPDYVGRTVDAIASEVVKVEWREKDEKDVVRLYTETKKNSN